jgi:hypothetical protein
MERGDYTPLGWRTGTGCLRARRHPGGCGYLDGIASSSPEARPPLLEDLVSLCRNLNHEGARYVVIGGMAIIQERRFLAQLLAARGESVE